MPKSLALIKNWLNYQEKTSFLLFLKKSTEPIFQSAGPILRHTALEGTLFNTGNTEIPIHVKIAICKKKVLAVIIIITCFISITACQSANLPYGRKLS